MKSPFKKVLCLIIFIGLLSGAIGLTVSYFSDKAVSPNNKFSAGTLEINLENASSSSSTLPFKVKNMAPYEKYARVFKVQNSGSLPLEWTLSFQKTAENEGIEGGKISQLLQGEISEAENQSLLQWLNKAKNASSDEARQEDLDYFIEAVNSLRAKNLIAEDIANDLIMKAKMLQ